MENNKRYILLKITGRVMLLALIMGVSSCKNYLTVEPIDRLTGNNFYLSKADVEANFADMYSLFFNKIQESWLLGAAGEARSGEMKASPQGGDSRHDHWIPKNAL